MLHFVIFTVYIRSWLYVVVALVRPYVLLSCVCAPCILTGMRMMWACIRLHSIFCVFLIVILAFWFGSWGVFAYWHCICICLYSYFGFRSRSRIFRSHVWHVCRFCICSQSDLQFHFVQSSCYFICVLQSRKYWYLACMNAGICMLQPRLVFVELLSDLQSVMPWSVSH